MNEADTREENLNKLKEELNGWMPSDGAVEELLDASAKGMADLDVAKEKAGKALNTHTATTIADLEYFGDILRVYPYDTESVEHYRKRIETQFRKLSISGKPEEILDFTAALLEISREKITIENIEGSPNFLITVPGQSIENTVLNQSEAAGFLSGVAASTYGGNIKATGTLKYISKTEYNNSNYDTSKGYATLDQNDDVTSGGTYSALY
jgi:hypothetical protein